MLGRGKTADVIEYGSGKVCKLFHYEYPREYVELEYKNAKEVFRLGLRVPKPHEIVSVCDRMGIVYEKIVGETLLSQMNRCYDDILLDIFVRVQREWHNQHSSELMSYKDYLNAMLKNADTDDIELLNEISALPDGDCVLHGDFHPNNIIVCDGEATVIDFINVCTGPPMYDIARTYFLLRHGNIAVATKYLSKINVTSNEIGRFLSILERCRVYER